MQINKDLKDILTLNETALKGEIMSLSGMITDRSKREGKAYIDGQYVKDNLILRQDEQLLALKDDLSGLFKTDGRGFLVRPDNNFFEDFDKKHNIKTFADFANFYDKVFKEYVDLGFDKNKIASLANVMEHYLDMAKTQFGSNGSDSALTKFYQDVYQIMGTTDFISFLGEAVKNISVDIFNQSQFVNPPVKDKTDTEPPPVTKPPANPSGSSFWEWAGTKADEVLKERDILLYEFAQDPIKFAGRYKPPSTDDNWDWKKFGEGVLFGVTHPFGVIKSLFSDGTDGVAKYINEAGDPNNPKHNDFLGLSEFLDLLKNTFKDATGIDFTWIFYAALFIAGYLVWREVRSLTSDNKPSQY